MKASLLFVTLLLFINSVFAQDRTPYTVVDTGQKDYYSNHSFMTKPNIGDDFFGQDSSYLGVQPSYTNNNDGTITDNNTGLIWQKSFSKKLKWNEAVDYANNSTLAGFNDWRIPTVKELYSLINFEGKTGTAKIKSINVPRDAKPYINTKYFDFEYSKEKRYIDAQYWTQTDYVSTTMKGNKTFFGVNFADGRIKGYPKYNVGNRGSSKFYLRLVRGNKHYGENDFIDQHDGTIYDKATKLTWMKYDSGHDTFKSLSLKGRLNWKNAVKFCENLNYASKDSWRLPNAKELQSIVDYTKSPDTTNSAALNELFSTTTIKNPNHQKDYGFYWTSTTHLDGPKLGSSAVYIAFGRALGFMKDRRTNTKELLDVHGAGAQRSDPKSGNTSNYPYGRGPQGDVIGIDNLVRCVYDDLTVINNNNNFKVETSNYNKIKSTGFERKMNKNQGHLSGLLNRFDKNQDKKISYDEAPQRMKENFERHDENGDGYLDADELNTLPKPR